MPRKAKAEQPTSADAAILRQGMTSQFWLTMKKYLEPNIDYLESQILDNDALSVNITLSQRDFIRKWREYCKELLETPEKIIAWIENPNLSGSEYKSVESIIPGIIPDDTKRI